MKYVSLLIIIILAGCERGPRDMNSCYVRDGFLQGYTTGKVLHCEIHADGSVSARVQP